MTSPEILGAVLLVIGAAIAVAEMHTLTVYLIALAVACFAAAAAAFSGAGLSTALGVLAVVTLLGLPVAHWARRRMKNRASEEVSQDDVGHTVRVIELGAEHLRVAYRGSEWNARMQDAKALVPQIGQHLRIIARDGNTLVLGLPPAA